MDRRRYSGPELSDLLDRVVAEYGEQAEITAVNRIRSGGVAGFFCREEFEVIVERVAGAAPRPAPAQRRRARAGDDEVAGATGTRRPAPAQAPAAGPEARRSPDEPPTRARAAAQPTPRPAPTEARPADPVAHRPAPTATPPSSAAQHDLAEHDLVEHDLAEHDLVEHEVAERVAPEPSRREPRALEPRPAAPSSAGPESEPVFGGPVAPGGALDQDRFRALLERRLEETSATEADLTVRRLQATRRANPTSERSTPEVRPEPVAPAPAIPDGRPEPEPEALPSPIPPTPSATPPPVRSGPSVPPGPPVPPAPGRPTGPEAADQPIAATDRRTIGSAELPAFWRGLDDTSTELASFIPHGAPVTAVVGPLALATAVTRRLLDGDELAEADVFVLTDRPAVVSEPDWRLVRTGNRLVELVARRVDSADATSAPPTILVIEAPTDRPGWVASLQHRLWAVGVGLFRYAVDGRPTRADLDVYRQGGDVPYVIDLVARAEPAIVADLLADRHPVVSVGGLALGPELLLALRRHAGTVTDG